LPVRVGGGDVFRGRGGGGGCGRGGGGRITPLCVERTQRQTTLVRPAGPRRRACLRRRFDATSRSPSAGQAQIGDGKVKPGEEVACRGRSHSRQPRTTCMTPRSAKCRRGATMRSSSRAMPRRRESARRKSPQSKYTRAREGPEVTSSPSPGRAHFLLNERACRAAPTRTRHCNGPRGRCRDPAIARAGERSRASFTEAARGCVAELRHRRLQRGSRAMKPSKAVRSTSNALS